MKSLSQRSVKIIVMVIPSAILLAFWLISGIGAGYWGFDHNFGYIGFKIDAGSVSLIFGETDLGGGTGFRSWFDPHTGTSGSASHPKAPSSEPDPFGDLEVPPPPTFLDSLKGRFEIKRLIEDDYAWSSGATVPFWLITIPTIIITVILGGRDRNRRIRRVT